MRPSAILILTCFAAAPSSYDVGRFPRDKPLNAVELADELRQHGDKLVIIERSGLGHQVIDVQVLNKFSVTLKTDAKTYDDDLTTSMHHKGQTLRLSLVDDDQRIATLLFRGVEEIARQREVIERLTNEKP